MKINLNSEIDLTLIVNSKREIGLVHFHFGGVLFKLYSSSIYQLSKLHQFFPLNLSMYLIIK